MHHVTLERWSRGSSPFHGRDARVKVLLLAAFLVALSTTRSGPTLTAICYGAIVVSGIVAGRLPLTGVLIRAAIVVPFSATFAILTAAQGDWSRAVTFLLKSYLSAGAVLVVAGTTPLPRLLRALESRGVPAFLTLVAQFLYRYLFVISEQSQHMRLAAECRGGRRAAFRAAAGAVAVLFSRSYARAEGIHQAMLARGFEGRIELLAPSRMCARDVAFLATGFSLVAAVWIWAR